MHYINHHKSVTVGRLLCIFCLFLPVLVFSQIAEPIQTVTTRDYGDFTLSITETKTYDSEWAAYQNELENINPPSGILYDRAIPISNIELYDGTSNSPVCTKAIHDQILLELKQAGLMIPEASSSQTNYAAADLPPYDRIKLKLSVIGYDRKDPYDNQGSGTIENETVLISTSRDTLYEGNVIFRLDSDDFKVNHPEYSKNSAIYIDFGYGFGYQRVYVDTDIIIRYQSVGDKTIRVQLDNSRPAIHDAQTQIYVASVKKLYKYVWTVQHDITKNSATITHLSPKTYADPNFPPREALVEWTNKPIIFIEGFDPDSSNTASAIYYKHLNKHGLAECLLKNGYDIFIVDFNQNADYIQYNGWVVIELLKQINNYKIYGNNNTVIGFSMGGLVGKYALSYMENNNIPHETSTFITIDSPHGGAYIPIGMQYFAHYMKDINAEARASIEMLNSPAARQMLIYHYAIYDGELYTSLRTDLLNDFADLGHPQKCRTIAISNGNPHGVGLDFNWHSVLLDLKIDISSTAQDIEAVIWSLPPKNAIDNVLHLKRPKSFSFPSTEIWDEEIYIGINRPIAPPFDNAPGGFSDAMEILANKLKEFEHDKVRRVYVNKVEPYQCFIPTISSLELNIEDPYFNVAGAEDDIYDYTPFDEVYYHRNEEELEGVKKHINLNQPHVEITKAMIGWLELELVPEHLTLDGSTHSDGEHKATKSITLKPGYHSKNAEIKISGALDCSQ